MIGRSDQRPQAGGDSQRHAGRSDREFNPSNPWVYAEMIKLTPISKPGSEAGEPAAARSEDRERVGRRGTAPVERSRAAADYLVAGRCPEPMQRRVNAIRLGAFESTVGTPFDLGIAANSAPRIIPEIFDMIQTWIHQDNSEAAMNDRAPSPAAAMPPAGSCDPMPAATDAEYISARRGWGIPDLS